MSSDQKIDLNTISETDLLQTRLSALPIALEGTWLQEAVTQLEAELKEKGLVFCPSFYLADEWLTPDQEPVVGLPFFLAHPTLIKLEKKMMLEVEGGTKEWCLKILRHETGHALNYAYRLFKTKKWRETFGNFTQEYEDVYRFRPYSKNFVRHLEDYYAQYHPDEDFAETFAVWLTPNSNWREHYVGWGALKKLNYVDAVLKRLKDKAPLVKKGKKYWAVADIQKTLKSHYAQKQKFYAEDFPDFHDTNLKRIFSTQDESNSSSPQAATVIKQQSRALLQSLTLWTGEKKYITHHLLNRILKRCRELNLVCTTTETVALLRISTYLAALLMNYRYTGRLRGHTWHKNKA